MAVIASASQRSSLADSTTRKNKVDYDFLLLTNARIFGQSTFITESCLFMPDLSIRAHFIV